MNDHIYQGTIGLGKVSVVVLDEADRMLDMGFEPQVKSILRCVTNKKQTMLFSATMPQDILKLATSHMKLPISIEIAPSGTAAKDVSQELFIVKEASKNDVIKILLQKYHGTVLVFTRTKMKASRVTRNIRAMGAKVAEIHSNRSMTQRMEAMEGFKRGRYRVLVATDIAARGIDVSMIELVVNYDLPDDAENYVHRIGRTGRAGKEGHAVTLATPAQSQDIREIENLIKKTLPRSLHPHYANAKFDEGSPAPEKRSGGHRPFRHSGHSPGQAGGHRANRQNFGNARRYK
jgi:ATP-dependent RNA helicase RhlE